MLKWLRLLSVVSAFQNPVLNCFVELPEGKLQGEVTFLNYCAFKNIPYAQPPIGTLRFEAPVKLEAWRGTFYATGEPVLCVQFINGVLLEGQEDCLIINIYTPKRYDLHASYPVFVWLHGGGFQFGSGNVDPRLIMDTGDTIFVAINYRLGPLGFLSTGDLRMPGNNGLKDQQLALEWIKRNIEYFGGNPEQILLLGNSAGGASVHYHLLNKNSEKLFTTAFSSSGTALCPWVLQENALNDAKNFGKLLNCSTDHTNSTDNYKFCLQRQSIQQIWNAARSMYKFLGFSFAPFRPVIEPDNSHSPFLTKHPEDLIKSGQISKVPWLVSYTTDEGVFNAAELLQRSPTNGREYIELLNIRWNELAPFMLFYNTSMTEEEKQRKSALLHKKYMCNRPFTLKNYKLLEGMFSDLLYIKGIIKSINLHRIHGNASIYAYVYGNPHRYSVGNFLSKRLDLEFGAAHSTDAFLYLPLTFGIFTFPPPTQLEKAIAKNLFKMLRSFAVSSVPRYKLQPLPSNNFSNKSVQYLKIFRQGHSFGKYTWHRPMCDL